MTDVLMLLAMMAAAPAQSNTAAVEQEIRDFEQKYNAAYAANDRPAYFSYLASDFVQWLAAGNEKQVRHHTVN
jgi:ketosteroid isomerase-like protein